MEVYIAFKYDVLDPDCSRRSDGIIRGLNERLPGAVWTRSGEGFLVSSLD